MQAIIEEIGVGLRQALLAFVGPLTGEAEARGPAAVRGIDSPEARNQALVDRPLRDLIRGVPRIGVGGKAEGESRGATRERILEEPIEFADVLVMIPGSIVQLRFKGVEQMA